MYVTRKLPINVYAVLQYVAAERQVIDTGDHRFRSASVDWIGLSKV